jgi:hypothetical protein
MPSRSMPTRSAFSTISGRLSAGSCVVRTSHTGRPATGGKKDHNANGRKGAPTNPRNKSEGKRERGGLHRFMTMRLTSRRGAPKFIKRQRCLLVAHRLHAGNMTSRTARRPAGISASLPPPARMLGLRGAFHVKADAEDGEPRGSYRPKADIPNAASMGCFWQKADWHILGRRAGKQPSGAQ